MIIQDKSTKNLDLLYMNTWAYILFDIQNGSLIS